MNDLLGVALFAVAFFCLWMVALLDKRYWKARALDLEQQQMVMALRGDLDRARQVQEQFDTSLEALERLEKL
jgi:hypothetical protein